MKVFGLCQERVISRDTLADAAGADPPDLGPYRRVDDLEPRLFITPAIAKLEVELEERRLTFIEEAAR